MTMACVLIELKYYEITSQSSYGKISKDREKINILLSREKKSTREIANFSKIIFCLLNEDLFCENAHIVNVHLK